MRAEYKKDLKHNYLILQAEQEVDTASYQLRMLMGNTVPVLLPCQLESMNGSTMFYYETTALEPVAAYYEHRKIDMGDLELLLMNLVGVLESIEDYLLDSNQLILAPEYMYLQPETKQLYLCYLPGHEQDVRRQFQGLTEYLLPKINHEDPDAVMLGYGIYRQSMEEGFYIERMKEEIYQSRKKEPRERVSSYAYDTEESISEETEAKQHSESTRRKAMDDFFASPEEDEVPDEKENQLLMSILGITGGLFVLFSMFLLRSMGFLVWMTAPVMIALLTAAAVLTGMGWTCYQKKKKMESGCKPEKPAL